jgi:hypothetical protein
MQPAIRRSQRQNLIDVFIQSVNSILTQFKQHEPEIDRCRARLILDALDNPPKGRCFETSQDAVRRRSTGSTITSNHHRDIEVHQSVVVEQHHVDVAVEPQVALQMVR